MSTQGRSEITRFMKTVAINATFYLKCLHIIFIVFSVFFSPDFDTYWYKALQAMPLSKRKFREERHLERHTIFKKETLNCTLYSLFTVIMLNFDTRNARKKFTE